MKCFLAVLGLLAVASANPGVPQLASYSYANPAGVTYRGTGFSPGFSIGPAQPVAAPALQQYAASAAPAYQQYAAAAPAYQQYAAAAPAYHQYAAAAPALQYHHQTPAVAVTQKVGYAHHQVPIQVPGVADVPVTKLAYTQGVTQKLVDVAQPAVTNRRVKVRRPALRKEFYDIEHRVIVRPAGSATLELSQPISKEQKGPAVLTPTNYQQIAPVVRYGLGRQIIDGQGVSQLGQARANQARGIESGPAPAPLQRAPQPEFRAAPQPQPELRAAPQPQQFQPQPQPEFRAAPQPQPQPEFRAAPQPQPELRAAPQPQQFQQQPEFRAAPQPQPQQFQQQFQQEQQFQQLQQQQFQQQPQQPQQQQFQQGPAPEFRSAAPAPAPTPRLQPLQLRPQGQPRPQLRSADAEIIDADSAPAQQQPQQIVPQQQQGPAQGPRISLREMPVEIQARLLELLSAKGGTVTEVLGENGAPNSASVLQVADALQDVNLQGGERITTRRIVVTRPIETIQEVDIQEPATKIHRTAVNVPTLFKTPIQGIARVPVSVPGVKNVATPVLQTTYAAAAPFQYSAGPAYAY